MSDYPTHIEIEPNVHLVRGLNEARFPEANTLLIDDEILTLVDAGSSPSQVFSTLKDLGHEPEDLDRIVLTHYHADHKGYAEILRNLSNCEVLCHPLAEDGVRKFENMLKFIGIDSQEVKEHWLNLLDSRLPHVKNNYTVDGHFQNGKAIDCGEVQLIPLHSPGHTHDHTCFGINGLEKILLVDIDLTDFGPWYGNVVSDITEFKTSIQRIIDMEPEMGISSHLIEPVTVGLKEQLENYLSYFQKRDDEILRRIAAGAETVKELSQVPIIYPRIPHPVYYAFEEFMLEKHLSLLEKKGQIVREDGHLRVQRR
jgi:glyoxylase-like metal-dependent hydrolase (beta-lactamase superfamily II)